MTEAVFQRKKSSLLFIKKGRQSVLVVYQQILSFIRLNLEKISEVVERWVVVDVWVRVSRPSEIHYP